MTPTGDLKKKLFKQVDALSLVFKEHGLKSSLTDLSESVIEFTVVSDRPLTLLVKELYSRAGVERVLVTNYRGRNTFSTIQICFATS